MKIFTTSLIAALSLPAAADIITLKDGSKIDATILEKNLEELKVEVHITSSIKEPRTIKRSDVVSIEAENEADTIFEEKLMSLTPAPPFLSLQEYDDRIKMLKDFLKENEVTSAGTKVTHMLTEIEGERQIIATGGIKISTEPSGLIKAEDRAKDKIGIASRIEAQKFKDLVEKGAYVAALRQYDVLEQDYPGTMAHRKALPLMSRLVNSYAALLSRKLESAGGREERLAVTLDRLPAGDKKRAMQAEEQRMKGMMALQEKEEAEGQVWMTVDTSSVESLQNTIQKLEQESERLVEIKAEVDVMGDLAELYRQGWIAAGEKKEKELEVILASMEEAGASQEELNLLVDRFDPTINNPPAEEGMEGKEMEGEMMKDKMMDGDKMMDDKEMDGESMQDEASDS